MLSTLESAWALPVVFLITVLITEIQQMEGRRESIDEAGSYNERSDETNGDSDMLYTGDGSLDWLGRSALKGTTGGWKSGTLLLGIFFLHHAYFMVELSMLGSCMV